MTDIFRIDSDKSSLTWSGKIHSKANLDSESLPGRLVIKAYSVSTAESIRTWRLGVSPDISSFAEAQIGPRLYEEMSYSILLSSFKGDKVELRHRDPTILQGLSKSNGQRIVYGNINFKSQVGRSRFTVFVNEKPEYDFEVEVFPSKLDYKSDYDAIVADVQDILAGLVLEYLQSTFKLGFTTHSIKSTKLEWITLLRHLVDGLERALRYISQHPQHGLTPNRLTTRVERLRRSDTTILKMVIQGKGFGPTCRTSSGLVLKTQLPEHRARVTLNTPEHRWLAKQLTRIRRQLAHIHSDEQTRTSRNTEHADRQMRIVEEIGAIENRIAILERLQPIAAAEGAVPAGFTSLKLQASPGYREAYRACLILLLGLRVAGGPVGLSVKQIHQLYEYWCYLALVRLLAEITGEEIPVSHLLAIEQNGIRVQLHKGKSQTVVFPKNAGRKVELTYSPQYKGDAFIFAQNPDMVLTLQDPAWPTVQLVFDAKYRITYETNYVNQLGSPGPPQDAINVLHRYRDAILEQSTDKGVRTDMLKRRVIEGVALFPYRDAEEQFKNSRLLTSLDRVGVGALPFLPSQTRYVGEWLRAILQQGGWATAERSISHGSQESLTISRNAQNESVLIGPLRNEAKEHFDWIKRERRYFTTLNLSQPRQLTTRWIAIYSPASLRSRGAVTHIAMVRDISIQTRDKIETPWKSNRDLARQCVVYELEELKELATPIENRGPDGLGQRFSKNRWTSRLGLLRANELRELFLETEPEWKLYEQLQIANVDFTLRPEQPKLPDEDDPRGRTWFVVRPLRIQYRGSAGFLIRSDLLRDEYHSEVKSVVERVRLRIQYP